MKVFSINLTEKQKVFLTCLFDKGYSFIQTTLSPKDSKLNGTIKKVIGQTEKINSKDFLERDHDPYSQGHQIKGKQNQVRPQGKRSAHPQKEVRISQKMLNQQSSIKNIERERILNDLLDQIENKKSASIFIEPVDPIKLQIPNYLDVIKEPMAILTMRQKIKQGKYANFVEFENDLQRIVANCLKFNAGNTFFIQVAKKFSTEYKKVLQKQKNKIKIIFDQSDQQTKQEKIESNSEQQTNSEEQSNQSKVNKIKKKKTQKIQKNTKINQISQSDKIKKIQQKDNKQQKIDPIRLKLTQNTIKSQEKIQSSITKKDQVLQKDQNQQGKTQIEDGKNNDNNQKTQLKQKKPQKLKQKNPVKLKKYSYQDRMKMIQRIKSLDRDTMTEFFKEINFSKGESLDFKVLEDSKIKEMQAKLIKFEAIHQEKMKKIKELNKGKQKLEDFEIEEDKDYQD